MTPLRTRALPTAFIHQGDIASDHCRASMQASFGAARSALGPYHPTKTLWPDQTTGRFRPRIMLGDAKVEASSMRRAPCTETKGFPQVESRFCRPLSPYATTKLCRDLRRPFARTHASPRGFAILHAWAAQILRCLRGLSALDRIASAAARVFFATAQQSRLCYIDDVVQANLLAASAPAPMRVRPSTCLRLAHRSLQLSRASATMPLASTRSASVR